MSPFLRLEFRYKSFDTRLYIYTQLSITIHKNVFNIAMPHIIWQLTCLLTNVNQWSCSSIISRNFIGKNRWNIICQLITRHVNLRILTWTADYCINYLNPIYFFRFFTDVLLACKNNSDSNRRTLKYMFYSIKVQVHDQIFFAKDCMPCNRLCRNCSCYWSIFRRCLSLNKGLPL